MSPAPDAASTLHTLTVPPEAPPVRLDRYLASALPSLSRARIQKLIDDGHVRVEGRPARAAGKVRPGVHIVVEEPAPVTTELLAQDIPLKVLFEDASMVVLDKAAGMVVHPAAGHADGTLVNALLGHVEDLPPVGGELRPGIVHRLDKDTSGVMVVAKGDQALHALQSEFKDRRAQKKYVALCRGKLDQPAGTLTTRFGRHPAQRLKFTSKAGLREAVTDYRVLGSAGVFLVVELTLHTGRTHQIRVHLSEHGAPIVGDELYGGRKAGELPVEGTRAERQMLHAAWLSLAHPVSGEVMRFFAPPPDDMVRVAGVLGLGEVLGAWAEQVAAEAAGDGKPLRRNTSGPRPARRGQR